MNDLKKGSLVKIVTDPTGEFTGYHGQLGKKTEDGTYEIDFTYNMTRLSGDKFGAFFSPDELEIVSQEQS